MVTTIIVYLLLAIEFPLLLLVFIICLFLIVRLFIICLFLIVVLFYTLQDMFKRHLLNLSVWRKWCRQGKYVLFVYSNSPNWQNYIEERILPQIRDHSIILNWSERKTWPPGLAVDVFNYYGGGLEFNPMAVVFQPHNKTKVFRFFKPFHKRKKGHPEDLEKMEKEMMETIEGIIAH